MTRVRFDHEIRPAHKMMVGWIILGTLVISCATQLKSPPGQLFCAIATQGGGQIVAKVVEAQASTAGPTVGALAILATDMSQAFVQSSCQSAAAAVGGLGGVPVSPPADPASAPPVAIVRPTS